DVPRRIRERAEPLLCVGEGLGRCPALALVGAPPPDAVVLLGDVRELEVDGEGAEDERLALEVDRADELDELLDRLGRAAPPGAAELPRALLELEQLLALLLDDHQAERVAEQADVAA